ncbi:MAG TPA: hypothetical protein PLC15_09110, partial [Candidatus Obscuribacter sp.]|nr:hypothetical protein [Candidatus Obscuribacter sp.]
MLEFFKTLDAKIQMREVRTRRVNIHSSQEYESANGSPKRISIAAIKGLGNCLTYYLIEIRRLIEEKKPVSPFIIVPGSGPPISHCRISPISDNHSLNLPRWRRTNIKEPLHFRTGFQVTAQTPLEQVTEVSSGFSISLLGTLPAEIISLTS